MPSTGIEDAERRSLLRSEVVKPGPGTPLPKAQLGVIFAIKLAVVITGTQALPYINELIAHQTGRPKQEIGYFTGLLSLVSHVPQILSAYPWGRASDRFGRKLPIFLVLVGLAASSFFLGVGNTFALTLFAKFLNGLFSGSVGVLHSVVGDLTDSTNASLAFPIYDIVAAVGFIVGPLIGGFLVHPDERFPAWFNSAFWLQHPYLLPCLAAVAYAGFAVVLNVFVLKETNPPTARNVAHLRAPPEYQSIAAGDGDEDGAARIKIPGVRELLSNPMIRYISASSGAVGFMAAAFNLFFTLLAYSDLEDGGLAMKPSKIGIALSLMGAISIPLKFSLPFLLTKFSTVMVFRSTLWAWPATFLALPLLSLLAWTLGPDRSSSNELLLWIGIGIVLFLSRLGCLGFGLIMILTKEHTTHNVVLGAANSIVELAQMFGILLGPPIITSLFAFSVTNNIFGGYLWALVIVLIASAFTRLGVFMDLHEQMRLSRQSTNRMD